MDQKTAFLEAEGDRWFERNRQALAQRDFSSDKVIQSVANIAIAAGSAEGMSLLEIGCGGGERLAQIAGNLGIDANGLDPSAKAVEQARKLGSEVRKGTADKLPFEDDRFDILIFGFCLYLCDRADLFRIAAEAERVLKPSG